MGMAELVDAPVLLAGDIDRGGVFAQLYGTVALLEEQERARIGGLIINKFRGDEAILRPGLTMLEEKTGIPVLGVVPYLRVNVDDEDSLAPCLENQGGKKPLDIAVIRLPRISNFTDFSLLDEHPAMGVRYVGSPRELGNPDLVILPGTKSTLSDLLWLRQSGLEAAVCKLAHTGTPVLGICGGYQMLGETLSDPYGTEGGGEMHGMGLLPIDTVFSDRKTRTRMQAEVLACDFAGAKLDGYEIHTGKTTVRGDAFCLLENGQPDGCVNGNVFGTYLHGLFDTGSLTHKLAEYLCRRKGISCEQAAPVSHAEYQEQQFDLLADGIRHALDMKAIYALMEGKR